MLAGLLLLGVVFLILYITTDISVVVYEGVLHFHSETGTEGGHWAFQDANFITKNVPKGYCKKCGLYLKERDGTLRTEAQLLSISKGQANYCAFGEHEEEIGDAWSYKGHHILKDGDYLNIYSKDNYKQLVWSGKIKLKYHPSFTKDVFGFWVHSDQKGQDREVWAKWFFEEYSAVLIKKPDKKP